VHSVGAQVIGAVIPRQTLQDKEQERALRKETVVPELAKLMKEHDGDWTAFLLPALRLYGKQEPNPFARIGLEAGAQLVLHIVCVLALPKRQSLPDFAAGIVTTRTRRPPGRRRPFLVRGSSASRSRHARVGAVRSP
jgi:hypothetical protein